MNVCAVVFCFVLLCFCLDQCLKPQKIAMAGHGTMFLPLEYRHNLSPLYSTRTQASVLVPRCRAMPPEVWGCCDYCGYVVGKEKQNMASHIGREHDWRMGRSRNKERTMIASVRLLKQRVTCDVCNAGMSKKSLFLHIAGMHSLNSAFARNVMAKQRRSQSSQLPRLCDECQIPIRGTARNLYNHWLRLHTPYQSREKRSHLQYLWPTVREQNHSNLSYSDPPQLCQSMDCGHNLPIRLRFDFCSEES